LHELEYIRGQRRGAPKAPTDIFTGDESADMGKDEHGKAEPK
jgi:hypothetical protein